MAVWRKMICLKSSNWWSRSLQRSVMAETGTESMDYWGILTRLWLLLLKSGWNALLLLLCCFIARFTRNWSRKKKSGVCLEMMWSWWYNDYWRLLICMPVIQLSILKTSTICSFRLPRTCALFWLWLRTVFAWCVWARSWRKMTGSGWLRRRHICMLHWRIVWVCIKSRAN